MKSVVCFISMCYVVNICFFFFQAEDGIRDYKVTGVQTCALPICRNENRGSIKSGVLPQREKGSIKTRGAAATKTGQYKKWDAAARSTGQNKKRGAAATRNGQYKKRGCCRSENW